MICVWEDFAPASCLPDSCFCEAVRDGAIRQPSNTWSSLAFCVAGAAMAVELARRPAGRIRPVEAACFALAVFLVGATSALYHASLTFIGQWLDVQSMYLLVLACVAVNVDALRPGKPQPRFAAVYALSNVALGVLLYTAPPLRRYAFGVAILGIAVTELMLRRRQLRDWPLRPLAAATAVQGVAFGVWILDTTRTVCLPFSPVQGHAVWHALGAVATWALWRYYRGP